MRNIWKIGIGVVLVVAAGIAVYDAYFGAEVEIAVVAGGDDDAVSVARVAPPQEKGRVGTIEIGADEYVLGEADAPVTIVEYASLTCPHCANFHTKVLPDLKKKYIDTGKVRLVYRDFPFDKFALAASVLAKCAKRNRYFGFLDMLYKQQARWARAEDPVQALSKLGLLGGVPPAEFQSCLKDEELQAAVLQQRLHGSKVFQVNSTPTLIINGVKYASALTLAQIEAIIAPLLPKG